MYNIRERAKTMASALNLPVFIAEGDRIEPISTGGISMDLIPVLNNMFLSSAQRDTPLEPPFYTHLVRFNDNMGTTTLNIAEITKDGITAVIFGPMFLGEESKQTFIDNLVSMEKSRFSRKQAMAVADTIAIKDANYVESWGNLALTFFETPKILHRIIHKINLDGNYFNYEGVLSFEEGRMRESEIYANYTFEKEIEQFLKLGDKSKLKKLILKVPESAFEIRETRSRLIRMDARFQNTAEETGLSPLITHTISLRIRNQIYDVKTQEDAASITNSIIDLYCDAINTSLLQSRSMKILKLQRYITNHIDEKLYLDDLSEEVGLAPEYLCRRFKIETHMTITQYIQQLRVNEAIWLLRYTDKNIMAIAQSVGFQSQSNFAQVFLKHTGQTPTNYRKTHH